MGWYRKLELIGLVLFSALAGAALLAVVALLPAEARGNPGFIVETEPALAEVCVDEQDLIGWMRGPPGAIPSTEIFMMLRGGHAEVFLQVTGGSSLAGEPRVIYLYHAPDDPNAGVRGRAAAAVGDASGCFINMSGQRTTSIPDGFAGVTMTIRQMCSALAAAGSRPWNRCAELTGMPNGLLQGPASWERKA